jgi:hypothetical protein
MKLTSKLRTDKNGSYIIGENKFSVLGLKFSRELLQKKIRKAE